MHKNQPSVASCQYDNDAKNATGRELGRSALTGILLSGVLQAGLDLPAYAQRALPNVLDLSGNTGYDGYVLDGGLKADPFYADHYEDLNADLPPAPFFDEDYTDRILKHGLDQILIIPNQFRHAGTTALLMEKLIEYSLTDLLR